MYYGQGRNPGAASKHSKHGHTGAVCSGRRLHGGTLLTKARATLGKPINKAGCECVQHHKGIGTWLLQDQRLWQQADDMDTCAQCVNTGSQHRPSAGDREWDPAHSFPEYVTCASCHQGHMHVPCIRTRLLYVAYSWKRRCSLLSHGRQGSRHARRSAERAMPKGRACREGTAPASSAQGPWPRCGPGKSGALGPYGQFAKAKMCEHAWALQPSARTSTALLDL